MSTIKMINDAELEKVAGGFTIVETMLTIAPIVGSIAPLAASTPVAANPVPAQLGGNFAVAVQPIEATASTSVSAATGIQVGDSVNFAKI